MNPLLAENKVLQTEEVIVIFEEHQAGAAEEVAKVYPSVKSELAGKLGVGSGLQAHRASGQRRKDYQEEYRK